MTEIEKVYYRTNRFQDLFKENQYINFKNFLYNYLLRSMSVEKNFKHERPDVILEVGSGISPVMRRANRIIYSDLSVTALQILKRTHKKGWYVVADGMNLPFRDEVFSHTISSEVLEHIKDDQKALSELARVMRISGRFIITFPHRKAYFANDDRFVNHFRRYELAEMVDRLKKAGFEPLSTQKVLGPLEKLTMCIVVFCFSKIQKHRNKKIKDINKFKLMNIFIFIFKWANRLFMGIVWLDARIMPMSLATVLLIKSTLLNRQSKNGFG